MGLLQLFQSITRAVSERVIVELHAQGHTELRYPHAALLANLNPEGSSLTELAERAGITKQAMGELLKELEHLGYVERQIDPQDRRTKRICFTESGRRGFQDAEAIIRGVEDDLFDSLRASLGSEGSRAMHTALVRMLDRVCAVRLPAQSNSHGSPTF